MKILILIFVTLFGSISVAYAGNTCEIHTPVLTGFQVKVNFNVNLRSAPCVIEGNITGGAKQGEIYRSIRQIEGFHEIKNTQGTKFWVWDQAISQINLYELTLIDQKIIDSFVYKVDKAVQKKGNKIQVYFIKKLGDILEKYNISERERIIFTNLKETLEQIYKIPSVEKTDKKEEANSDESEGNNDQEEIQYSGKYEELKKSNIEFDRVKDYWMQLYNNARDDRGIYAYKYSSTLEKSAFNWSESQKANSFATHKRDPNDEYYDYKKITSWLGENNVVCKNSSGFTHTENVGWGTFTCNDGECSEELNEGIKRTFDFFMKEEFEEYKLHYLSVVNEYFTEIGLGIAIQEVKDNHYEFYLTVHYCTELE